MGDTYQHSINTYRINAKTRGDREEISTYINGIKQEHYDEFVEWLDSIEKHFINQTNYVIYPQLPPNHMNVEDLFAAASDEEKEAIFMMVWLRLIKAYRHWSVDLDSLYTDYGIKKHAEKLKELELIWKPGVRNWNSFFYDNEQCESLRNESTTQLKYGEWTLVKDQLPPEPMDQMKAYWITDVYGNTHVMFYIRADISETVNNERWYGPVASKNIVAWTPLLKPYNDGTIIKEDK